MTEENQEGKLTEEQKIYLFRQFLGRLVFLLIWLLGTFLIYLEFKQEGDGILTFDTLLITGFMIAGIVALIGSVFIGALDLFWTKPIKTKGILSKYQERAGRSVLYWIIVGTHKILTTERVWLSLQAGAMYKLTYARWTKQLLSYEQLSTK